MKLPLLSTEESFPNHNKLFILGCLLSALPIWLSTYPPMVDISYHGNQIATLLRLLSGNELNASLLEINWFTPYWFGYACVALLALFMPIVTAIKIILSITIITTPWLASRLRALVSNDDSKDWVFLPVIYSFSFQMGFLNFIVSIPFILLFLRESIIYLYHPTINFKRFFILIFLSHVLFFTHILSLAFALIIVFPIGIFLSDDLKKSFTNKSLFFLNKQFLLRILPFISVLPIIILWITHVRPQLFDLYSHLNTFPSLIINLYRFPTILSSATGSIFFYSLGAIYAVALFFLPNAKIFKDWRAFPFIITILVLLLIPSNGKGGNFIAERFNVFIFIFYVFSFNFSHMNTLLNYQKRTLLFATISCFILIGTGYKIAQFDQETHGLKNSFTKMVPHRRLLTIIDDLGEKYNYPVFGSAPSWYYAEKNGYGNSFFSIPTSIVQFKVNVLNPFPRSQYMLKDYIWNKDSLKFDYFIIKGDISKSSEFLIGLEKYAQPIYHEGDWHLYSKRE